MKMKKERFFMEKFPMKIKFVILFFTIVIALSGCSFSLDVSTFMDVPKLTGDYGEIQSALEKKYDSNVILSLPLAQTLENQSSIILCEEDKAVVCFKTEEKGESTYIAVVRKVDGVWNILSVLNKRGCDVDRVFWGEISDSKNNEIVVGWRSVSNSDNFIRIYQIVESDVKECEFNENIYNEKYNEFLVTDIDLDGKDEIFFVSEVTEKNGTISKSAQVFKFKDDDLYVTSKCRLRSFMKYFSIKEGMVDSTHKGIFLDGFMYWKQELITYDLVYWNAEKSSIEDAFVADDGNDEGLFIQPSFEKSRDIDGDGIVEIPVSKVTSWSMEEENFFPAVLMIWEKYNIKTRKLENLGSSTYIKNEYEGYAIYLTDEYISESLNSAIYVDTLSRTMVFEEKDEKKLEIKVFTKDKWKENSDEYQFIAESEKDKQVYAVKYFGETNVFPFEKLKENFKFI